MEEKATAKNKAVSVVASVALAATLGVPTAAFADDTEKSATQQAIEQQAGEAGQDAASDESQDSAAAATGDAVDASSDGADFADGAEGESASVALLSNDENANDATAGQEAEKSVAQIGDATYTSLNEAIFAAKDGETVTLLDNAELTSDASIAAGVQVSLDLAGKRIDTNGHCVNIAGDLTVSGDGTVVNSELGTSKDASGAHTVFYVNGGNLTVSNGTYETKASMLIVVVKGVATVNGGSFKATGTTAEIGSVNGTALVRADGSGSRLNINAGTFVADALDSNQGVALYGVYGSNGAEMTFGTKGGAGQPSIISGYSAIGLNNTTSSPAVTITVHSGMYKAGLGTEGAGKFSSVMYLSGKSKVAIDGGEFVAADSSVHLLSVPYANAGLDLSIDGGSFNAKDSKDVIYFEGAKGSAGSGANSVSVSGGDFTGNFVTFKNDAEKHDSFVSGGSFDAELPSSLVADGSALLVDADGAAVVKDEADVVKDAGAYVEKDGKKVYYTTSEAAQNANPDASGDVKTYCAVVDGVKYTSLADAISAAGESAEVALMADTAENITIPAGKNITLDLAGFTLSGGTVSGKAAITNNGTFTLKDSSEQGAGRVIREDDGQPSYYVIDNQGTMTVESGTVYNNAGDYKSGSSLVRNGGVKSKAVLNIKGGTFEQEKFIVIKNDDYGTLNMTGGTIKTGKSQVIDGVEYTPSGVQNWGQASLSGGVVDGAVWTSAWSDDLDAPKTVISGDAHIKGSVILDRYSSSLDIVPEVSVEGGTLEVDEWKVEGAGVSLEVSGGTFVGEPPAEEFIVPGSGLVKDENGNLTAIEAKLVAAESVVNGVYSYDVSKGKEITEADLMALMGMNVDIEKSGYTISVDATNLPALNKAIGAKEIGATFDFVYSATKDGAMTYDADGAVDPVTVTVKLVDSTVTPGTGDDQGQSQDQDQGQNGSSSSDEQTGDKDKAKQSALAKTSDAVSPFALVVGSVATLAALAAAASLALRRKVK